MPISDLELRNRVLELRNAPEVVRDIATAALRSYCLNLGPPTRPLYGLAVPPVRWKTSSIP
ncbi:MAG: hypothetical protein ABWY81_05085 [Jiangellaceae bacterium]